MLYSCDGWVPISPSPPFQAPNMPPRSNILRRYKFPIPIFGQKNTIYFIRSENWLDLKTLKAAPMAFEIVQCMVFKTL